MPRPGLQVDEIPFDVSLRGLLTNVRVDETAVVWSEAPVDDSERILACDWGACRLGDRLCEFLRARVSVDQRELRLSVEDVRVEEIMTGRTELKPGTVCRVAARPDGRCGVRAREVVERDLVD